MSSGNRIHATYWVETPGDPTAVAEALAGEQSTGTFVDIPFESALMQASAARIESIELLGEIAVASLSVQGRYPEHCRQAMVTISWPQENVGGNLPNLLATVAGNLFEMKKITGLRLVELKVPDSWSERMPGPQFGVEGTRWLSGVTKGPLVGTIIKPSVGMTPSETADMVRELCLAGIDFIKDDELQGNGPNCPLAERVTQVMRVINEHAERTGRKVMFAFNITDETDAMRRHHDLVVSHGGTCVMASLNSVGLSGLLTLRNHAAVPIHGHRNGWGYLGRSPALGFSYAAWQVFWRLAGADHLHVNGLSSKFSESDETVIAGARACLSPLFPAGRPAFEAMPVFSSAQWAGQVFPTYAAMGTTDLIYACGGGIMSHPDGIAAGVTSIRDAWAAAEVGIAPLEAARSSKPLARALEFFGK